jgi:voltage-gated potassium channel
MAGSQEALDRFERQTAWPMLVLSLAIIPLLIVPLLVELPPNVETLFFTLDWFIWATFAVEYGIRLYLAPQKARFLRHNLIDLIVVVIPLLRPLRIARSARALRLLRLARVVVFLLRAVKAVRSVLTRHGLQYALLTALGVTVGAAILVREFERASEEANIVSFPDALWWAVTTVATVGYGDRFPTTAGGRGVAVVLMLVGIALFGLLAGSITSMFVEKDQGAAQADRLDEVAQRLDRIERALATNEHGSAHHSGRNPD